MHKNLYHPLCPQHLGDLSSGSVAAWEEGAVLEVIAQLLGMRFPYFTVWELLFRKLQLCSWAGTVEAEPVGISKEKKSSGAGAEELEKKKSHWTAAFRVCERDCALSLYKHTQ